MADYSFKVSRSASANTVGTVGVSAVLRRVKIYDVVMGSEASGDSPFAWLLQRVSALGTGSAVVPATLNPADGGASFLVAENHSIEPTYTADTVLLRVPLNQRATFRWIAAKESARLIIPAVQNNGVGVKTPIAGAVTVTCQMMAEE